MSSPAIECHKLSKRYGRSKSYALKELDLQINTGEVYGFLGPNGAGKSTTIRTLMNFIQPTSGSATILGKDAVKQSVEIKKSVGYLPSDPGMYRKMTGKQFLDYMEELQPASSAAYRHELVKRLKADTGKRLQDLSRGNRQKIAIIQAFMHEPEVLILDEPTSGLDPLMQEVFYALVHEAKQRGATVFTSSHILSEVQKMCDRVGIIRDGRLIDERSIADMINEASHTFDITFDGPVPLNDLKKVNGLKISSHDGNRASVHLQGELSPLFAVLARHKIIQLDAHQIDLEEMFMRFYHNEEGQS